MRTRLSLFTRLLLASLALAFSASAQDDGAAVKISTTVVQLDIFVTDKQGNVVTDLKPGDLEITENGTPRSITGFTLVRGTREAATIGASPVVLSGSNSSAIKNATPSAPQVGRILAIVVDDASMAADAVSRTKQVVEKFIRTEIGPNDLVAIVKTTGTSGFAQRFTNDQELLLSQLGEIRFQALGTSLTSQEPMGVTFGQEAAGMIAASGEIAGQVLSQVEDRPQVEQISEDYRRNAITIGSMQNLRRTIEAMGPLRGRKTILFISQGANLRYTESDTGGLGAAGNGKIATVTAGQLAGSALPLNSDRIELSSATSLKAGGKDFTLTSVVKYVTEIANRNGVTLFTVDPRGAVATNLSAADNTRGILGSGKEAMTTGEIDQAGRNRALQVQYQHEMLTQLADDTGGRSFVNTNDLDKSLTAALASQDAYYLVAYQPDEETFDPKTNRFNKISVKAKRPGLNVEFRSGFFNVALPKATGPAGEDADALKKLLAPYDISDLEVSLSAVEAYGDSNSTKVRAFVSVPASSLVSSDGGQGKRAAKFDQIVTVIGDTGVPLGFSAKNYSLEYDASKAVDFEKGSLTTNFSFQMPRPGTYKIKVLVRDTATGRVGTATYGILVPDLEKDKIGLSGILLQNFTAGEWQAMSATQGMFARLAEQKTPVDTASRRFKKGTVLSFIYSVYASSAITKSGPASATVKTRLVKDGKEVLSGAPEAFTIPPGAKSSTVLRRGGINLGASMSPGKYTLMLDVSVAGADRTETQSIDFQLVDQ